MCEPGYLSETEPINNNSFKSLPKAGQRAAGIRDKQRRRRQNRLAYIASLEERIREYEQRSREATIQLQKHAQKLDVENRKLKRLLVEGCGIVDIDINQADVEMLIAEIKRRIKSTQSDQLESTSQELVMHSSSCHNPQITQLTELMHAHNLVPLRRFCNPPIQEPSLATTTGGGLPESFLLNLSASESEASSNSDEKQNLQLFRILPTEARLPREWDVGL